ncbi:hypothetical protein ACFYKT_01635 [Cytobacillus sp. FJAT-53684]|uniref:Uncharacterized protein n=1 Tax=Cytobacillus mangrovibacter TaxID=3299024 RepID=A0ABW6JT57_9BACI
MSSIFSTLKKEGLTTLKIRYDWRTDKATLYAAKDWEGNFNFLD